MGSSFGPVLANIFLVFCECRIPDDLWLRLYRRFVDDTFALLDSRDGALAFWGCLNELHPSLHFTMESEDDGQLPFMDVRVRKEENVFTTAIYRKPTFTGLYTRWDSYGPTSSPWADFEKEPQKKVSLHSAGNIYFFRSNCRTNITEHEITCCHSQKLSKVGFSKPSFRRPLRVVDTVVATVLASFPSQFVVVALVTRMHAHVQIRDIDQSQASCTRQRRRGR